MEANAAAATGASKVARASRPTLFVAALATVALAFFPSFAGLASGGPDSLPSAVESSVVVLAVEGMTCEACVPSVRAELLNVPGVIDAAVGFERKTAEVRLREERAPEPDLLLEAVAKAGYTAQLQKRER